MKTGIQQIVDKTIQAVIVAEASNPCCQRVFLMFTDRTYFEIWGDAISGAGGIDSGGVDKVRSYVTKCGLKITVEAGGLD
jgi:hypothetical protein